jgi:DNA mismatch repair protein MutS
MKQQGFLPPNPKVTPARRQYLDFKAQYPQAVLFFRMGDFYECFDEDAHLVSREIDLTLSARQDGIPMAGVPHHAVETYIARLVDKGYAVAVVDQIGNEAVNGTVPRELTQIYTPGTLTEAAMLHDQQNNYLLALALEGDDSPKGFGRAGLAYVDITTGEFAATQIEGEGAAVKVLEELIRLNPKEVLIGQNWLGRDLTLPPKMQATPRPDYHFDPITAGEALGRHFRVKTLEGFGLAGAPLAVAAAGAALAYLQETQQGRLSQITQVHYYSTSDFMTLDTATRRSLELTETMRNGATQGSLLGVLDRTVTPMGARLLRKWIGQPILDLDRLQARLEAVAFLHGAGTLRADLLALLRHCPDLERLANRLLVGRIGARDLQALARGLRIVPELRVRLMSSLELNSLYERLDPCDEVVNLIDDTLTDEPPAVMNDIGTIRRGVSQELDEIYRASEEARHYISTLEEVEKRRTGLKTLKVSYNKVFGYYIEISRGLAEQAPAHYIRKQTLVNAERFITPEMKEQENIILNADERLLSLEREIFADLVAQLARHSQKLLKTARAIAFLDALLSLAEVAAREGYTRPQLTAEDVLEIRAGRHPVVEKTMEAGRYVPNDVYFDGQERIHIITGPNMAGKSTLLRQTALIVLMAQIGSYVPADSARVGLVDRIFTRVGAQDEIHAGQSTFMVEMLETANILNHATARSLVILDEIGRGTSTYDGMAIARAVLEYLHNHPRLNCKTMFATHYHELTELADILPYVVNYSVAVAEQGEHIVFLHQVKRGRADRSYGVHVAALAGVPRSVVKRAAEILLDLEAQGSNFSLQAGPAAPTAPETPPPHPLINRLKAIKAEEMSPLEALTALYELKRLADSLG